MSLLKSLPLVVMLVAQVPVALATPEGEAALRQLGAVNGVALECGHLGQVRRIKQAVVDVVPKQRYYGALFEQATHDGFLAFIEAQRACPTEVGLAAEVDTAVQQLKRAFP